MDLASPALSRDAATSRVILATAPYRLDQSNSRCRARSKGGRRPSHVASRQRIAQEAAHIACLFQELGHFGRCSLDAVLLDSGALHWIECNGRWGGVSIPMTLINRLLGGWQNRAFMIVHRTGLRIPPRSFAEVVSQLRDRLFRYGGPAQGTVLLTADGIEAGTGFHFLVLTGIGRDPQLFCILHYLHTL